MLHSELYNCPLIIIIKKKSMQFYNNKEIYIKAENICNMYIAIYTYKCVEIYYTIYFV